MPSHRTEKLKLPDVFYVARLEDPTLDAVAFPWHHPYLEDVWLAHLGPSTAWLYRRLARMAATSAASVRVELDRLIDVVGLGNSEARLCRSTYRLVHWRFAEWLPASAALYVRTTFMPAPASVLDAHPQVVSRHISLVAQHPTGQAMVDLVRDRFLAQRPSRPERGLYPGADRPAVAR